MNPYQVTKDFERTLCEYTGAPFAVAVNSCTAALQLALAALERPVNYPEGHSWYVEIPRRTYCSVPMAIIRSHSYVQWRDENWRGAYQLKPTPIWDCARRFTSGMYIASQVQCVSFATTKILGIEQGGAILHDDAEVDSWFRAMRFDGRTEGTMPSNDTVRVIGHHCLMLPSIAAQLILKLHHLPRHNEDLLDYPYPDLSTFEVFQ